MFDLQFNSDRKKRRAQVNGFLIPAWFCRISSDSGSASTRFVLCCWSFEGEKGIRHYCYSNLQVGAVGDKNTFFVEGSFDHHSLSMQHPELWAS